MVQIDASSLALLLSGGHACGSFLFPSTFGFRRGRCPVPGRRSAPRLRVRSIPVRDSRGRLRFHLGRAGAFFSLGVAASASCFLQQSRVFGFVLQQANSAAHTVQIGARAGQQLLDWLEQHHVPLFKEGQVGGRCDSRAQSAALPLSGLLPAPIVCVCQTALPAPRCDGPPGAQERRHPLLPAQALVRVSLHFLSFSSPILQDGRISPLNSFWLHTDFLRRDRIICEDHRGAPALSDGGSVCARVCVCVVWNSRFRVPRVRARVFFVCTLAQTDTWLDGRNDGTWRTLMRLAFHILW